MDFSNLWLLDAGNSTLKFMPFIGGLEQMWKVPTALCQRSSLQVKDFLDSTQQLPLPSHLLYCSVIQAKLAPLVEVFSAVGVVVSEVTQTQLEILGLDVEADGVGLDRLVAAFAAWHLFQKDVLVLDMGTATTFDLITAKGHFLGGAIFTGLGLCKSSLVEHAAALFDVPLDFPDEIIAKNTQSAIQSGILFGYSSLVERMLEKFAASFGSALFCVATGGWAKTIWPGIKNVSVYTPELTLQGLAIIAKQQDNGNLKLRVDHG